MSRQTDPIQRKFSSLIYHTRTRKHLTQAAVAEGADISKRWYQRIEKGEARASSTTALRIMAFLEIDSKYLREGAEFPNAGEEDIA